MTFEEVFTRHNIHPQFWAEIQAFILVGAKPTANLQVRLDYVQNYQDCLHDLTKAETHNNIIPAEPTEPIEPIEPFEPFESIF